MKLTQFRKLIREEISRVLKEVTKKASALVIDENGKFSQQSLSSYYDESYEYEKPTKLTAAKAAKFPADVWANPSDISTTENAKWVKAVAALSATSDFYNLLGNSANEYGFYGGEKAFIAAVPKGSNIRDYVSGSVSSEREKVMDIVQDNYGISQAVQEFLGWSEDEAENADHTNWDDVVDAIMDDPKTKKNILTL
jgi:hypothetical protein